MMEGKVETAYDPSLTDSSVTNPMNRRLPADDARRGPCSINTARNEVERVTLLSERDPCVDVWVQVREEKIER